MFSGLRRIEILLRSALKRTETSTMNSNLPARSSLHARALLIAAVAFISYAYFYGGGGWNANSRFDLVRAILERGTLSIDAYHENTEDKVVYQGHYYSDKAPGVVLLALPAAAAAGSVLRAAGMDPTSPRGLVAISYVVTLFSVGLPTALACSCLFLITMRLGGNVSGAAFAALGMGLATPIWAYATRFWSHALAGACLLFAFAAALRLRSSPGAQGGTLWGLAVGLAAGWATVSEYPAAPAAAILAILALVQVWPDGWRRRLPVAAGIAAGAIACIVVLTLYQRAAFGSALRPSYSYYPEGAFPWMKRGYMGLTYPRIDVLLKLLLGCRRGLFFAAPVAVASPLGLGLLWKQRSAHGAAVAATAIAAYYLLFNSSFAVWDAGWSYGPRYMAAGVPVLCIGLAPAWGSARPWGRKLLGFLALCSVLFSLMAVSTTAQPPNQFRCPGPQLLWPSFWAGRLSLNHISMLTRVEEANGTTHPSFNLGELAGLHGLASLIPLLMVWGIAAWLWVRMDRAATRQPASLPSVTR